MEEPPLYQIVDWDEHFENNKSRERRKCGFVCFPNHHGGLGLGNLLSEPDGRAIYGIWCLIVQLCSRQATRQGWLTVDGKRDSIRIGAAALARAFHAPIREIYRTLQVVNYPDIGWMKLVEGEHEWSQKTLAARMAGHLVPAETGTECPSPQVPEDQQTDGGHSVPAETGTECPERKKERSTPENRTVPTTTVSVEESQDCENEGLQYAEAKVWLNDLFKNSLPWSYEEDHLLSELVPIPREIQREIDWAHRLPPSHPIHEMTKLKQKRVSILRELGGEADKIRKLRRQMGYNGFAEVTK
jgi:hypothetical protein